VLVAILVPAQDSAFCRKEMEENRRIIGGGYGLATKIEKEIDRETSPIPFSLFISHAHLPLDCAPSFLLSISKFLI